MKYLTQGSQCAARFELLLSGTKIRSEDLIAALRDHLVTGLGDATASLLNNVPQSNFKRGLDAMEHQAAIVEKVKEIDLRHLSVK